MLNFHSQITPVSYVSAQRKVMNAKRKAAYRPRQKALECIEYRHELLTAFVHFCVNIFSFFLGVDNTVFC
jgi:hypothetical protein